MIVFLTGFRTTGKSTIGKQLALRLSFKFIEMDKMIFEKTGQTVSALTENGTNWQPFRQAEHEVLQKVLEMDNMDNTVVSTGGGVGVNDVVRPDDGRTYGIVNSELMQQSPDALTILITAPDAVIRERIRAQEAGKYESQRPILDKNRAREIKAELKNIEDPETRRELEIKAIVDDSMRMYEKRKPLYSLMTDITVDTGSMTIEESVACAEAIVRERLTATTQEGASLVSSPKGTK